MTEISTTRLICELSNTAYKTPTTDAGAASRLAEMGLIEYGAMSTRSLTEDGTRVFAELVRAFEAAT